MFHKFVCKKPLAEGVLNCMYFEETAVTYCCRCHTADVNVCCGQLFHKVFVLFGINVLMLTLYVCYKMGLVLAITYYLIGILMLYRVQFK